MLFTDQNRIPTAQCSASSQEYDWVSCSKALDDNMMTDFATKGEGVGAWIEVWNLRNKHMN